MCVNWITVPYKIWSKKKIVLVYIIKLRLLLYNVNCNLQVYEHLLRKRYDNNLKFRAHLPWKFVFCFFILPLYAIIAVACTMGSMDWNLTFMEFMSTLIKFYMDFNRICENFIVNWMDSHELFSGSFINSIFVVLNYGHGKAMVMVVVMTIGFG